MSLKRGDQVVNRCNGVWGGSPGVVNKAIREGGVDYVYVTFEWRGSTYKNYCFVASDWELVDQGPDAIEEMFT